MTCFDDAAAVTGAAATAVAAPELAVETVGGFDKDLLRSLVRLLVAVGSSQVTKDQRRCGSAFPGVLRKRRFEERLEE